MRGAQTNAKVARPFGELLRQHRLAAGLAQETLAQCARLSVETISALERGVRQKPYLDTIAQLAEALGLSAEDRAELERAAMRRSALDLAGNLPAEISSFIGRERDVTRVKELLANERLLTLVGAGGVGKTRLALRVAADSIKETPDGVWFVDLARFSDASSVPVAIASSIGLEHCALLEPLVAYLQPKHLLLVLDNCEHLIDGVVHVADAILRRCRRVRILATSRQALAVGGERIYHVPPLSVPPADAFSLSAGDALQYGAVKLFAERAEAAESRFELTEPLVPIVIDICRRLDGIALAIELAAARTNRFSLDTIAGQLQEHFLLATGGSRAPLPRHKTMQALFDWSYDLLSDREQSVFRRLAVFAGGFTLDLATAVCANGDIGNDEVVNAIASLVDKSLVQAEAYAEPARYRLLEPPRQYAREKLRGQGEDAGALHAHALALLALAESFDSSPVMTPDRVWDTVVVPERENFRVAIGWALGANGDVQIAQRLAGSRCATRSGFASGEARQWVRGALETCDETTPPNVRARLEVASVRVALVLDGSAPETALTVAERALLLQQQDDLPEVAEAQYLVALGLFHSGRIAESETALRQALATARRSNAPNITAAATAMLGMTRWALGDLDEARSLLREALRIHRTAGSERFAATDAGGLAEIEFAAGQCEEALHLSQESIEVFRTHGNWSHLAWALSNSSVYLIALGRYDEARNDASEALLLARKVGVRRTVAWALQHLAALSAVTSIHGEDDRRSLARSAHLIGFIDDRFGQIASTRQRTEQEEYEKVLVILRGAFGEEEAARLMQEGKTWSEDRALAQALEI